MDDRPLVPVLVGPTAVGKTDVALGFCERVGGEIVAADSRQIYRGLRIGTAAPTAAEAARVPHHLVLFLDPTQSYSAAEFRVDAEAAIADILSRDRVPLIVAGTGFYLQALIEGLTLGAIAADPALRADLEALADREGNEALHRRLADVDPEAAERIHRADRKRLVRALEIHAVTGQSMTELHREQGHTAVPYQFRLFGLRREREALNRRINARAKRMMAEGWLDEVRALPAAGVPADAPAMESLGYRRLVAAERGELPLDKAFELAKQDTRQFAKRQMTWFRRWREISWFTLSDATTTEQATDAMVAWWHDQVQPAGGPDR